MSQRGFALVILFLFGILLISGVIIGGSIYIKSNYTGWIGNSKTEQISSAPVEQSNTPNTTSNTLTETTPCVRFNYPADFKLNPGSHVITTKTIREGASEYGSALLIMEKELPGKEAYGMTVFCVPSSWSNAQKSILKSNLDALNATLNLDINSGKDPYTKETTVKYDLTISQVRNIQNNNNLSATKIVEVFYTDDDKFWRVKENIYAVFNNYFYQFINTGLASDKEDIRNEIKQFEDLFQSAVLTNPISK